MPNADEFSDISCSYELPKDKGDPRYLHMIIDRGNNRILSAYIVNDLDTAGIAKIWDANDN